MAYNGTPQVIKILILEPTSFFSWNPFTYALKNLRGFQTPSEPPLGTALSTPSFELSKSQSLLISWTGPLSPLESWVASR